MKLISNYGKVQRIGNVYAFIPKQEYKRDFHGCNLVEVNRTTLEDRIYNWICLTPHLLPPNNFLRTKNAQQQ